MAPREEELDWRGKVPRHVLIQGVLHDLPLLESCCQVIAYVQLKVVNQSHRGVERKCLRGPLGGKVGVVRGSVTGLW